MKLILALALIALTSCGGTKPEEPTEEELKKKISKSKVVGRIVSVSPHSGFALIQKFGPGKLPTKGVYQTVGEDGRAGSIRPSGERVRDFFAADIVSGETKTGDAVVYRPFLPTPVATAPAEETPDSAPKPEEKPSEPQS